MKAWTRGHTRARWLLLLLMICPNLAAEIRVTDFVGRDVVLARPAQRVVALAPHVVENLFSAGAGDKLVGVVSFSDFPIQAQEITPVGTHQAFSVETILSLQPDLVIMWASGNGMARLDELAILQVPIYVSEPRHLSDIGRSIRDYEILTGRAPGLPSEADRIDETIKRLRVQYSSKEDLSIFYQIWNEPLQTLNGQHLISKVMDLCGAHNVFADAATLAPRVNLEAVLERDPDLIVASGVAAGRPQWLDQWLDYPFLRAVQSDSLFFIHPDHIQRPTARILLGAERLCRQVDSRR